MERFCREKSNDLAAISRPGLRRHHDAVRSTGILPTFTIDADEVLQDEHIGDASIEGKLKKLVARAQDLKTGAGQ